ncbi:MAG: hypothetical protein IJ136_05230 [Erysipelotrichaceae bacterium]|nr:hypothetical protein [Erysipelotrichaceae bacterium]
MTTIINQDYLYFALALTMLMAANAASGAMKALQSETFEWKKLIKGVEQYGLWLICATLTVAACSTWGSDIRMTIGSNELTFLELVEYAKIAVYGYWAAKAIQNFIEYGEIKKEVKAKDPQLKINTDTSVIETFEDTVQG